MKEGSTVFCLGGRKVVALFFCLWHEPIMNNCSPSPSPVPAAERARQTVETLDQLQAGLERVFSRLPVLLRLLMQLFARLREVAAGMADAVPAADQPAAAIIEQVAELTTDSIIESGRAARVPAARAARTYATLACQSLAGEESAPATWPKPTWGFSPAYRREGRAAYADAKFFAKIIHSFRKKYVYFVTIS